MTCTLLISTYNWPEALRLCLLSAFRQTRLPDHIIICDDGSKAPTKELIDEMRTLSPTPIKHIWHEDKGFRLAKIRNRGMAAGTDDYIIQIDGDIILHPAFVADHLALAAEGVMLRGRRVPLNQRITERLCKAGVMPHLGLLTRGIEKRRLNALHCLPVAKFLAARYRPNRPGIMGCNMSFSRRDILAVNGYDEKFEGWGSEDSDLCARMQMNGVQKLDLKFAAVAFHLWHGHAAMQNKEKNERWAKRSHTRDEIRVDKGMDQYL